MTETEKKKRREGDGKKMVSNIPVALFLGLLLAHICYALPYEFMM